MNCPGAFTAETEEERMEHVELHATCAHPDLKLDEATQAQSKSLVKRSSDAPQRTTPITSGNRDGSVAVGSRRRRWAARVA